MSKPNRVFIRTYCECGCDCPTCHGWENKNTEVENCVYCQLKWAGKGEYSLEWRKAHNIQPPKEHPGYSTNRPKVIVVDGVRYVEEAS